MMTRRARGGVLLLVAVWTTLGCGTGSTAGAPPDLSARRPPPAATVKRQAVVDDDGPTYYADAYGPPYNPLALVVAGEVGTWLNALGYAGTVTAQAGMAILAGLFTAVESLKTAAPLVLAAGELYAVRMFRVVIGGLHLSVKVELNAFTRKLTLLSITIDGSTNLPFLNLTLIGQQVLGDEPMPGGTHHFEEPQGNGPSPGSGCAYFGPCYEGMEVDDLTCTGWCGGRVDAPNDRCVVPCESLAQ